jgi:hypothetical protein
MGVIVAVLAALAGSLALVAWGDRRLLGRGVPSLGVLVVSLYGLTYGLGWLLWRIDPSSLFGYGSRSTLGALDGLGLLFALGLPGLALGYSVVRRVWPLAATPTPIPDRQTLLARHGPVLQRLCEILLVLALVGLVGMASQGVFLRDPEAQRQALQSSPLAKLLVGSALLSRLAPVGLVLVPLVWTRWRPWQRLAVVGLLLAWLALGLASGSRGQLFSVPVYLFVGALLWRRLSWRRAALVALAGLVAGVVVGEGVRVRREGNLANPALRRQFETFQIGRQLLGTSHEFYALLRPADCAADLADALAGDPSLARLLPAAERAGDQPEQPQPGGNPAPAPDAVACPINATAYIAAGLHAVFERVSAARAVPDSWRTAVLVPIYKGKGDQADITSYRPLSGPTVACRVWRCLASGQVVPALTPCLCCGT